MDIDQLIDDVISREGGYSDHPDDRGGATKFGITQRVAREHGYHGPMRDMPRTVAERIYRAIYWQAPRFDDVATRAPGVAAELFDTGVNMGPATATMFLQRALNVLNRARRDYPDIARDGRIGPATLGALDRFLELRGPAGKTVLLRALNALQGARYIELAERRPANESFLYGWLANRIG
ncbi:hypothetical protein GO308_01990 [Sphingomonas sp. SFZ2018-12]|uniref:glycoside hydrolase family 108 protein n=1 Tax=Sphingomonas sp. SFZ2018-12 TaxID=2683197 RepID=UPI001F0D2763|nr:glycosyl hydrolase 108 family protein [Sphingomonas sp. SFZ2018-12]MCH4891880.1 hypothetical protein [Sphingomonas sp. SFZ2018-12]